MANIFKKVRADYKLILDKLNKEAKEKPEHMHLRYAIVKLVRQFKRHYNIDIDENDGTIDADQETCNLILETNN